MSTRTVRLFRGPMEQTRAQAQALLAHFPPERQLWLEGPQVKVPLGSGFSAVVLDWYSGMDADRLAAAAGLVEGFGCLVLRLPEEPVPNPALVVPPDAPSAQGHRLRHRVLQFLAPLDPAFRPPTSAGPVQLPEPLPFRPYPTGPSEDQERALVQLKAGLTPPDPASFVLLADRGRGKSATLGRLAKDLLDRGLRVSAVSPHPEGLATLQQFAGPQLVVLPIDRLIQGGQSDLLIVDEAAGLSVPFLLKLLDAWPTTALAFATTANGYEGTGRGFVLKFLHTLHQIRPTTQILHLHTPIRWAANDPLEKALEEALLLRVPQLYGSVGPPFPHPGDSPFRPPPRPPIADFSAEEHEFLHLDPDALTRTPDRLAEVQGLLLQAHYRTTPADLHRILDAPNLHLFGLTHRGRLMSTCLCAVEGGFLADFPRGRPRGHALPDTLVSHLGIHTAWSWRCLRSVRIATLPGEEGRGWARLLVGYLHQHPLAQGADLIGTLFGADPRVIRFRRSLGYELVRMGSARSERSGEPSVVMVRPQSAESKGWTHILRARLARDLPLQLRLLEREDGFPLALDLRSSLMEGLFPPPVPTVLGSAAAVQAYLAGKRPFESAIGDLQVWLNSFDWRQAEPIHPHLIAHQVFSLGPWRESARLAQFLSVPAAQRALRRSLQALAAHHPPKDPDESLSFGQF